MTARLRSWWEQIQKYRRAIGVVAIILRIVVVIAFIIAVVLSNGTGFNGYNKVIKEFTPGGQLVKTTTEYQPGKTLWNWLQLLIVPIILAIGGFWLNQIQKDRDQKAEEAQKQREEEAAKEREKLERESREDNQREAALEGYIDKMSELLLDKDLVDEKVRNIARVRMLTVLPRLDAYRKRRVLRFLYESGLIYRDSRIIDLGGADLRGADLHEIYLFEADLSITDLRDADLRGAKMNKETILKGIKLQGAIYNTEEILQHDRPGLQSDIPRQEKMAAIKPTQWPQGFEHTLKDMGLIVDNTSA